MSDLRDQLRQAQKEIKRLQKFGTISRNVVNNLEATTSNKLLDATKMLMTATGIFNFVGRKHIYRFETQRQMKWGCIRSKKSK